MESILEAIYFGGYLVVFLCFLFIYFFMIKYLCARGKEKGWYIFLGLILSILFIICYVINPMLELRARGSESVNQFSQLIDLTGLKSIFFGVNSLLLFFSFRTMLSKSD